MSDQQITKPEKKLHGAIRRKGIDNASQENWVTIAPLFANTALPMSIQPNVAGIELSEWIKRNQEKVDSLVHTCGGVLLRGFPLKTAEEFEHFSLAYTKELLEYTYRSTPRQQERGRIYTSTEYPADQSIPMHNELSYATTWPLKIWFFCAIPAEQGGETPIADSRKVLARIAPDIREQFRRKKIMYIRHYSDQLDLPWQTVFQTDSKEVVEEYCQRNDIQFRWNGEALKTWQVCQAIATHPMTGEEVWFNQAHLFHISNLPEEMRHSLLSTYKEELPRNVSYGDGSPIEVSTLEAIREAYEQETISFPWQRGDILLLDNMLTAHGRKPFQGARKVLVGMSYSIDGSTIASKSLEK